MVKNGLIFRYPVCVKPQEVLYAKENDQVPERPAVDLHDLCSIRRDATYKSQRIGFYGLPEGKQRVEDGQRSLCGLFLG